MGHAIRNGLLSARDIVERQQDRIATFNPALNAVVTLDADGYVVGRTKLTPL